MQGGLRAKRHHSLPTHSTGIDWPIRVIRVAVEGLVRREALPLSLFEQDRRRARLLGALDRLNDEWGEFTVADGLLLYVKEAVSWEATGLGRQREIGF